VSLEEVLYTLLAWFLMAVVFGLPALALWFWVPAARRLPPQRLRGMSWNGWQVLLVFFTFLLWPDLVSGAIQSLQYIGAWPASFDQHIWTQLLAGPAQILTILYLFRSLNDTPFYQLGLTTHRLPANLLASYRLWLVVTPLIYVLYSGVMYCYQNLAGGPPKVHPLMKPLEGQPGALDWTLSFLVGVVLAPVLEELTFRGTLQAWLTHRPWGATTTTVAAVLFALLPWKDQGPWPAVFVMVLIPGCFLSQRIGQRWFARPSAALAIYCSSLLFAVMHSFVWPTPIPLFFFSLALGWLAYRTQSLVGSITLHALFNGVAFLTLVFLHTAPAGKPENGKPATSAVRPLSVPARVNIVPGSWQLRRT
jgi:membrane protease YdiL (CAAX protease family)